MKQAPRPPVVTHIRARDGGASRLPDADGFVTEAARGIAAFRAYISELWERRGLIRVLAGREIKGQYEMNIVGFGWWLLEPLSLTAVYFVLIDILSSAGRSEPARLVSILVAVLPFKWFTSALVGSMGVVRSNATLVNDLYFPRALLPITEIFTGLAHFGIGLAIVPMFMAIFGIGPSWALLWLPAVIVVQFVFMLGLAYPLSVWGLNYRNLPGLMANLLRLWFYLSPGLYSLDRLEGTPRTLMQFNPLTGILEGYRGVIVTHMPPDWTLAYSLGIGILGTLIGGWYFTRREPHFGKML